MARLGSVLRSLRADSGLTQEELAERAGVSSRTVSDIERGLRTRVYRGTAGNLADALDLRDEQREEFVELARGRVSDRARELDAQFKRRFVAWHVDRVSSLADQVGDEENWYAVLDADEANLAVALRWADEGGDAESLVRLGAGLFRYWQARGALASGRDWLERGLRADPAASGPTRMAGLWALAWLAYQQGDDATTEDCARQLEALALEIGDAAGRRNAATVSGIAALARQDLASATAAFDTALALASDLDDRWLVATSSLNVGIARIAVGDTSDARRLIADALLWYDDIGDERFRARCLGYLGLAALVDHDAARAEALYMQSLLAFDDLAEAKGLAESLTGLATAAAMSGRGVRAAELAGAAERMREVFDGQALPVERRVAETELRRARELCDRDEWESAWTRGRALRQREAVAAATAV
ncbi:MAG TPA: helix-turn-helix transcriptional regulator [Candidatus Nanopelagicales bacterium]|nr:helix-turn-helix transcriptional regulator [Candidatus Nanopelagicales bacterium]